MPTQPPGLPHGGGPPGEAILKQIAAAHRKLAKLFDELASLPVNQSAPPAVRTATGKHA